MHLGRDAFINQFFVLQPSTLTNNFVVVDGFCHQCEAYQKLLTKYDNEEDVISEYEEIETMMLKDNSAKQLLKYNLVCDKLKKNIMIKGLYSQQIEMEPGTEIEIDINIEQAEIYTVRRKN